MSTDLPGLPGHAWSDLSRAQQRGLIRRAVGRPLLTALALTVLYFLAPLTDVSTWSAVVGLVLCVVVVLAVYTWQIRRIITARFPGVQAIEALAVSVPTYLLTVATVYHLMSLANPGSFNEPLTRVDSLYFTLSCFATVGFGDIVAETETARVAVTVQMVGNLLLLAVGVRLVWTAVRAGRRRRDG